MKLRVFPILLTATVLLLGSCKKDKEFIPADTSRFFRLQALEIGVIPVQRTVQLLFQVTDFEHKGVPNLGYEDFVVRENNGRIDSEADLKLSRDSIPYALKTVLLLDITRSVEGLVPQIKEAARTLIHQKLPEQEIAVYTFDKETHLLQDFTTNKTALLSAIDGIPETGLVNSTNLYGAIIDVADTWEDQFSIQQIVDGSLVLFTDGRHNATPAITLQDAQNALYGKKTFVAALQSNDLDSLSLQALAERPERYFLAQDIQRLEQLFSEIQVEIQRLSQSIYFLDYQSPITDPTPRNNELIIEISGNTNTGTDSRIREFFNSEGFGG